MVWHGQELAALDRLDPPAVRRPRWTRSTPPCGRWSARGLAWPDIRKEDFPLPGVSAELAQVNRDLEWGRGLVLLRGLPVERYSDDSCARSGGGSAATWAPRCTRTPTAS